MRRFLFWYLPTGTAFAAAMIFAAGFSTYVRGDFGSLVADGPQSRAPQAPLHEVAPLILGDSVARGTGDETGLGIGGRLTDELRKRRVPARATVNLAVNGARTSDLLALLERRNVRTLAAEANVIVISIGGNDLWGSGDWRTAPPSNPDAVMQQVIDRIDRIVDTLREENPNARIFLLGLYNPFLNAPFGPRLSGLVTRWNAKLMERFADDPRFTLVAVADIFAHRDRLSFDRFHPNDEGYALIARRIADTL